jgi:hypothetical protein
MASPHTKRSKGNWTQGKSCKGDSYERQFSKTEIQAQLDQDHETYLSRHKGKRKRNDKARLEYRMKWLACRVVDEVFGESYTAYLRSELRKAQKEYDEKFPTEKVG